MDISQAVITARNLCLKYEGPTIGVGATFYKSGVKVQLSDPEITKDEALELLDWMLEKIYFPGVLKLCASIDSANRLGAITDFAFNLGLTALKNSTLRKKILTGDWDAAKREILKWNKAAGKESSGLTKRRKAEAALL